MREEKYALLRKMVYWGMILVVVSAFFVASASAQTATPPPRCAHTVTANVAAIDQIVFYNRYGAYNSSSMIYALKRDVVPIDPTRPVGPGNAQLSPDKRPRPLVLRVNTGDCLRVNFSNWLTSAGPDGSVNPPNDTNTPLVLITGASAAFDPGSETATREASFHVNGLDLVSSISSDGSNVGNNTSSLVSPGGSATVTYFGAQEGEYLLHSMGTIHGGDADGGQTRQLLFGSVNVEPPGAQWYRSQTNAQVMAAATVGANPNGTPKINYNATGRTGTPLLAMVNSSGEIVHSDENAIIANFNENCANAPPTSNCGENFREFTAIFHDSFNAVEPFDEDGSPTFAGAVDGFGMDYGSSGMTNVDVANRGPHIGGVAFGPVGPTAHCQECKFEEFFLSSWANGDPALLVTVDSSGHATGAAYPDDPSNVKHSYLNDPKRFRNLHAGVEYTHVFHLHAHQWLHSPRDQNSTYFDSQAIAPGVGFTYEIQYGGSGNRNINPGDAIFHCHIYPHFSSGMWELWRNHDAFEAGTPDRNLPDGEVANGTANPAIIPIPGLPMPPMPTSAFKGYPFYIAGQGGHRAPQPPLDFTIINGVEANGGLPQR